MLENSPESKIDKDAPDSQTAVGSRVAKPSHERGLLCPVPLRHECSSRMLDADYNSRMHTGRCSLRACRRPRSKMTRLVASGVFPSLKLRWARPGGVSEVMGQDVHPYLCMDLNGSTWIELHSVLSDDASSAKGALRACITVKALSSEHGMSRRSP